MRILFPIPAPIPRAFGGLLLALTLCSCNLFIPENPSSPRYNSVMGAPRAPQLNPAGSSNGSSLRQPAPEVQASAFPPVEPGTEARAQEIMASDVPPPPQQQAARQMPAENGAPAMQVAGNYPDLHSIPPTPPMGAPDGADARLARVRAQLEAERNGADAARTQLGIDAAAEPSLIGTPLPEPMVPAPQSSLTPAAGTSYIAALPPPPPPLAQSAGTAWDRTAPQAPAPAPMAMAASPADGMEPIVLRAPSTVEAPMPRLGYAAPPAQQPASAMAPAMSGGFNPMAGADPILLRAPTSYAGGGNYLPNSRYTTRRN